MLVEAGTMIDFLPEDHVGCCVLRRDAIPFIGSVDDLKSMLDQKLIHFHAGALRGAWPKIAAR